MVESNVEEDEMMKMIINCGYFQFSYEKTANIASSCGVLSREEILDELEVDGSKLQKIYMIGKDRNEYALMNSLYELAVSGNLQAKKELDKMKRQINAS